MENYYNYSPEIPNGDDNPESNITPPQHEVEPTPETGKRRRRQKSNADPTQGTGANHVKEKKGRAEEKIDKSKEKQPTESVWKVFNDWLNSTVTRSVIGIIFGGLGFWFGVAFFSYLGTCVA
ncbi:MAG: hypothetical protein K2K32_06410, partial [Muribaculaceae bacterium]|nr:hypothetical protein [Muribaculaceae bacterium]